MWAGSARRQLSGAVALRLEPPDVAALYLILLARLPESEAVYRDNRGRPAADVIADTLRSPEFAERILPVLLKQGALPHEQLGYDEFACARAWLERAGIGRAGAGGGWSEALAILLTEPPAAELLAQILPQHAPRLAEAAEEIRRSGAPLRVPAEEADVKALYLLLLGYLPASMAAYHDNAGRPRDDVIARILASQEFRDRVLLPLLLDLPIPQQQQNRAELAFAAAWLTGAGIATGRTELDWLDLFAELLLAEPVARMTKVVLPAYAPRLRQRALRLRRRGSGRLPLADEDVAVLYMLLLGRRPEGEVVYTGRRGQPRAQLITDHLGSVEFRERVLPPLLGDAQLPHVALGNAELAHVRTWVEGTGVPFVPGATGWIGVLAAFLDEEPARSLVTLTLPADADRLLRRMAREAARTSEEPTEIAELQRLRTDLDAIDRRLKDFEAGWGQHVPAFLNAVSSVGAFAHEQAQLRQDITVLRGKLDAAKKAAD
jgi:hypothetical protein